MSIIYLLDLFGTFIFAVSGALSAAGKKFDLFGALFIGFITAVGGGTVRDLVLGNLPVFWVKDIDYLMVILLAVILTFLSASRLARMGNLLLFFDAVGIGVFTLVGIRRSAGFGITPVISVLLGAVTAVMGGIFRDVFCNEIPLILQKEIYATACLAGGAVYFLLQSAGVNSGVTYFAAMITVTGIRLAALKFKLSLPKISL